MIGKSGSYATVAPTQNYLGQALTNIEDNAFKYRQEKRLQEQQEAEKQEKDLARQDADYKESRTSTKIDLSGYNFVDNPLQKFSSDSFVAITDVKNQLRNTTDRATRDNLLSKQYKIEQNVEVAKQLPTLLKEKGDFIEKNIDKLDESSVNEAQKVFKAFEQQNYITELDENGVANVILYETDDKGQRNVIDKKPLADIVKGIKPYFKSKQGEILATAVKNTGTQTTVLPNGQFEITTISPTKEAIQTNSENYANALVSDENERYALSKRAKLPMTDVEGLKKVAVDEFKNAITTTYKKNYDQTKEAIALRRQQAAQKASETQEKTKPTVTYSTKTGKFDTERDIIKGIKMPKGTNTIYPKNVEIERTKSIKDIVKEVARTPDGKLYLRIQNVNEGSEGETVKEDVYERTASGARRLVNNKPVVLKTVTKRSNNKTKERIISIDENFSDASEYLSAMGETPESLDAKVQTMTKGKITQREAAQYNADIATKNAKARAEAKAKAETQAKNKSNSGKTKETPTERALRLARQ